MVQKLQFLRAQNNIFLKGIEWTQLPWLRKSPNFFSQNRKSGKENRNRSQDQNPCELYNKDEKFKRGQNNKTKIWAQCWLVGLEKLQLEKDLEEVKWGKREEWTLGILPRSLSLCHWFLSSIFAHFLLQLFYYETKSQKKGKAKLQCCMSLRFTETTDIWCRISKVWKCVFSKEQNVNIK